MCVIRWYTLVAGYGYGHKKSVTHKKLRGIRCLIKAVADCKGGTFVCVCYRVQPYVAVSVVVVSLMGLPYLYYPFSAGLPYCKRVVQSYP